MLKTDKTYTWEQMLADHEASVAEFLSTYDHDEGE